MNRRAFVGALALGAGAVLPRLRAEAGYAPGITDGEITLGTTQPLSGGAVAYSAGIKVADAYFKTVNKKGGVNGRSLRLIMLDDGFTPPKAVEQTRRLVEEDKVALLFGSVGTASNLAVRPYLNDTKVPQLFVGSAAATWSEDHEKYPWSRGFGPLYTDEGRSIAKHILATRPNAKIAGLFATDDAGKDYARGLKSGLGPAVGQMVKEQSYEFTDPTVDSQMLSLQASGADTLVMAASPKIAAQAIRKAYDSQWRPQIYTIQVATSLPNVLVPAGLEKAKGLISGCYYKDPADPTWADDPAIKDFNAFMAAFVPNVPRDNLTVEGMCKALTLIRVLQQCGNDLTRDNIMRQTSRLDLELPLLLPGLKVKTSDADPHPIRGGRLQQFDGASWKVLPENS
jgi:ABC-type branched-subunit amino acid transport system substrate-binding protein